MVQTKAKTVIVEKVQGVVMESRWDAVVALAEIVKLRAKFKVALDKVLRTRSDVVGRQWWVGRWCGRVRKEFGSIAEGRREGGPETVWVDYNI